MQQMAIDSFKLFIFLLLHPVFQPQALNSYTAKRTTAAQNVLANDDWNKIYVQLSGQRQHKILFVVCFVVVVAVVV